MKASELRVGNWVTDEFWESYKTHIKVESIDDNGINLIIQDDGNYPECAQRWIEPVYFFDQLNGIPLTPEILDKCGFVRTSINNTFFSFFSIRISREREITVHNPCTPNEIVFLSETDNKSAVVVRNYDYDGKTYLHQLQNAIHALTGEELNYQP